MLQHLAAHTLQTKIFKESRETMPPVLRAKNAGHKIEVQKGGPPKAWETRDKRPTGNLVGKKKKKGQNNRKTEQAYAEPTPKKSLQGEKKNIQTKQGEIRPLWKEVCPDKFGESHSKPTPQPKTKRATKIGEEKRNTKNTPLFYGSALKKRSRTPVKRLGPQENQSLRNRILSHAP